MANPHRLARPPRPRRTPRRWPLPDAGSVSVEMTVLVTPLFVVLLLFVVLCARAASAKIDVNAAASAAARAASMAPSPAAASTAAADAAAQSLAGQALTCTSLTVPVDTSAFHRGGTVQVSVFCTVSLSDLGLPGVPGTRVVSGTATAPIDVYHRVAP